MSIVKHQLRKEEYQEFPFIQPADELPTHPLNLTTFDGFQRLTMLDRYSLRDNSLKTLKPGDLVVTTVKDHPKYPTQGFGVVKEIIEPEIDVRDIANFNDKKSMKTLNSATRKIVVEIQYPESVMDDDGNLIDLNNFVANPKKTFKPLELYWEQICYRNAKAMASVEKEEDQEYWFEKFYWVLANQHYIPGGRILYGGGSGVDVTLYNCYVLPFVGDSRGKIVKHIGHATEIMARGGGVGSNISCLRPAKMRVEGVNGHSSGSVSWADYLSKLTHLIEQGGSRYELKAA